MAEMVPAEFWEYAINKVHSKYPNVQFIAEVYNPNEYRHYIASGFDYLYDKVGLYDTLRAIVTEGRSASCITGCWQAVDDIRQHMLNFLETTMSNALPLPILLAMHTRRSPHWLLAA